MAGLTNDLLEYLNRNLSARERVIESPAQKMHDDGIEEKNSLQSAISQLAECRRCFEFLVADPEAYRKHEAFYPAKKKEAGLPLDAARDFFKSHATRLANILPGKSLHFEKLLVRQRKENLRVVKDAYVELQSRALNPPKP